MPGAWKRARPRYARSVLLAGLLSTAGLAVAVPAASAAIVPPASASPRFTLTVPYLCSFPLLGSQTLEATVSGLAPQSVAPGQTFRLTDVQSTMTVPASLVDALLLAHTTVSGTITTWSFRVRRATPHYVNGANPALSFGPVPLTSGEPAAITAPSAPATLGPFTAGKSGDITISAATLKISTWFGTLHCSASKWSRGAPGLTIPLSSAPLPLSPAIGGAGAAAMAGAALIWRQRRRNTTHRARALA